MSIDTGMLIIRLVVGVLFIGHGAQKLFGWFGGHGLDGTAAWLESQGMRPGKLWALLAGLGEAGGGLLFALGLLGPIGGLLIAAAMFVAIAKVHWPNGIWAQQNGFEYPLVVLVVSLVIAAIGPGYYSLDRVLGIDLPEPLTFWIGLALAFLVAGIGLAMPSEPSREPVRQEH